MNRATAEEMFAACERALAELSAVERAVQQIENSDERSKLMRALGVAIAEILGSLRAPVVRQFPELDPPAEVGPPDTLLDAQGMAAVSQLTSADLQLVDRALLAECAPSWRKVARIVGSAMGTLQPMFSELPDGYYAQRVAALVQAGHLESQGNLDHMRFSEVRLPQGQQRAV
ncbi:MAG: DUF3658 domain-containing protein [Pyrinomonadaceae bacterium]